MNKIIVSNNVGIRRDARHFPFEASCEGVKSVYGRTYDGAVLELIRQNPDTFKLVVETALNFKTVY